MKKAWIVLAALAVMALPAAAAAKQHSGDPTNAAKYCKSLRVQLGVDQFKAAYRNKGKCVSKRVHELRAARKAAVQACQQELGTGQANVRRHGNSDQVALRQCVSQKLQAETGDDAQGVVNAAKQCAAERDADPAAFEQKYGTNDNHRNAFGKCVSQHANDGTGDTPSTGDTPPSGDTPSGGDTSNPS
jgi:hypothetical protein